ncbi:MAG: hypothetical protein NTZ33_02995 [Bacteroidetes bacterium]|nr:hypothetical protein [Bacteroidota bacterium]
MITKTITLLLFVLFFTESFGQTNSQYIPVTINSPLFITANEKETQAGLKINNYGLYFNLDAHLKRKIFIFSVQGNDGSFKFDPLNFNKYYYQGQEASLIQSYPSKMFYAEIGVGYNFKLISQKLSIIAGIGQQFQHLNTRYFLQLDWGNESRIINAGVSIRGNYTKVNNSELITLEPVIQGKIKINQFRIVNQFGYSIALKKNHDYMMPVFTIGMEYII